MTSELPSIASSGYPPADIASQARQPAQSGAPTQASGKLQALAHEAAKFLQVDNQSVQFIHDEATGKMVLTIVDIATKEIVRQIPSEEVLEIARSLDRMRGLLINAKA